MFFSMPWTCGCVLVLFSTWALPFSKRELHPTELSISAGCVCGLEVEIYFELGIWLQVDPTYALLLSHLIQTLVSKSDL
jgi:hypothetical protein